MSTVEPTETQNVEKACSLLEQALGCLGSSQHSHVAELVRQAITDLRGHGDEGIPPSELNSANDG
jgi:hypothetical protein